MTQWLEDLTDDVTVALRQLKASPAFTAVAVLTLALGIGANSAMFAVADATLLRPLPFPDADRLVTWRRSRDRQARRREPARLVDWSERNRTFEAMAASLTSQTSIIGTDGVAQPLFGQAVSAHFFDVLGVKAIAGRIFQRSDEGPAPNVVVIGEGSGEGTSEATRRASDVRSGSGADVHADRRRPGVIPVRHPWIPQHRTNPGMDRTESSAQPGPSRAISALLAGHRPLEAGRDDRGCPFGDGRHLERTRGGIAGHEHRTPRHGGSAARSAGQPGSAPDLAAAVRGRRHSSC